MTAKITRLTPEQEAQIPAFRARYLDIACAGGRADRTALHEGAQPVEPVAGAYVLAHSETGHNHVVMERPHVRMFSAMDEFRSYLVVEDAPAVLEHQRSFDTHESLEIKPGIYEVRRQREYTPEGFRRAAD